MLMSTLAEVIAGLGGRMRLVAKLPGRAPVEIALLGDLAPSPKRVRRPAIAARAAVPRRAKPRVPSAG